MLPPSGSVETDLALTFSLQVRQRQRTFFGLENQHVRFLCGRT